MAGGARGLMGMFGKGAKAAEKAAAGAVEPASASLIDDAARASFNKSLALGDALAGRDPTGFKAPASLGDEIAGRLFEQKYGKFAPIDQQMRNDTLGSVAKNFGLPLAAGLGAYSALGSQDDAEAAPGIRAFHGSPHLFDKFDINKIGTGEGAQAYGHGLYFGGNEATANAYRAALSGQLGKSDFKFEGLPAYDNLNSRSPLEQRAFGKLVDFGGDANAAINYLRGPSNAASFNNMADIIEQWSKEGKISDVQRRGHMYEVNLHVDPNSLLDWDKPLKEQRRNLDLLKAISGGSARPSLTGEDAYHLMRHDFDPAPLSVDTGVSKKISTALRDAGIPGIQYLDQGSRAAGEGTRNYVMFDDKPISILRRYAFPAAVAGAAGYAALNQDQADAAGPGLDPYLMAKGVKRTLLDNASDKLNLVGLGMGAGALATPYLSAELASPYNAIMKSSARLDLSDEPESTNISRAPPQSIFGQVGNKPIVAPAKWATPYGSFFDTTEEKKHLAVTPPWLDAQLGDYARTHQRELNPQPSLIDMFKSNPASTTYDMVHGAADSFGQDLVGAATTNPFQDPRPISRAATDIFAPLEGVGLDTDTLYDAWDRIKANGQRRERAANPAMFMRRR